MGKRATAPESVRSEPPYRIRYNRDLTLTGNGITLEALEELTDAARDRHFDDEASVFILPRTVLSEPSISLRDAMRPIDGSSQR